MKPRHSRLSFSVQGVWLAARLLHTPDVRGLVLLLHSSAHLAFRQHETSVTDVLQQAGYATLAIDLLTEQEESHAPDTRYNVACLTERVLATAEWIAHQPDLAVLPLGAFASDTASAAGIRAAARIPGQFGALSVLAGRPDLAGSAPLRALRTPTCFIVGQDDPRANILRQAFGLLTVTRDWQTLPGADPDQMPASTLTASAEIVAAWMRAHMSTRSVNPGVA